MFKHILLPTDGSAMSEMASQKCIDLARKAGARECDLICVASHGRKGMKGLLLGSEMQKVLTHTATPVLVYR